MRSIRTVAKNPRVWVLFILLLPASPLLVVGGTLAFIGNMFELVSILISKIVSWLDAVFIKITRLKKLTAWAEKGFKQ